MTEKGHEIKERVLGVDFVILKGRGGRESTNGATVKGDEFTHLSVDTGHTTICKQVVESFFMTYADVEITCPECIEQVKR